MKAILNISVLTLLLYSAAYAQSQYKCTSGDCNNGYGACLFPSNAKYAGDFRNGKMHGKGILYFSDGKKYIGHWFENMREGEGKMVFPNGDEYMGLFRENNMSGQGIMVYANGNRYEGAWDENNPHGFGVLTFGQGGGYQGNWAAGYFSGEGKLTYADGSFFDGQWQQGKRHGWGTAVTTSGQRLCGQWADDQFVADWSQLSADTAQMRDCNSQYCSSGQGRFAFKDGSRYFGDFSNGVPKGAGIVYFKGGNRYEGAWNQNAPHGQGVMYYANGQILGAVWENGNPVRQLFTDIAAPKEEMVAKTPEQDSEVKIWAVIVGAARYTNMPTLRYTDDDAYQIFAFLKSPEGGALPDKQLKVLIDEDATRYNIVSTMRAVFQRADENDVVLFYFSGHGLPGSFLPVDYDGANNKLTHSEIKEILRSSRAKHKLVVADACHSGSLLAAKTPIEGTLRKYYQAFEEAQGGTALLMSSKSEEYSLEDGGLRAGIFSHFLIRGLKGEADGNKDELVTVTELYNYIYKQVRTYTANAQSPSLSGNYDAKMPVAVIRH